MQRTVKFCLIFLLFVHPAWAGSADPHSYAEPDKVAARHLDLDVQVDFEEKQIRGTATWDLSRAKNANEVIFDVRDLEVLEVTSGDRVLEYRMSEADPLLGQALRIALPEGVEQVSIRYATSPKAAALQWLDPVQTAGGEHPFLFTQSQAILARTWLPCQDGPGVRFTYQAKVKVPKDLLALMSAENPTELTQDGVYTFSMPQPIPSYLMALAVGDLEFRDLGGITGIYAEPSVLDAAAYEFAETQSMVDAVEPMYGPYRWGRYDMLVLPPSFPFGGMENPRLTFLTPTVIAGDRSLTSLIAHELAHSWSGNLVTNESWNDFWLNEGFTVYIEGRIMEKVYGKDYAEMLRTLGYADLLETLEHKDPEDTHLKLDLAGRDPDEGLSDIAYEKGNFFLIHLERKVGREKFDAFLKSYFDRNAFKVVNTEQFLEYLAQELGEDLEVEAWVYSPGVPTSFEPPVSKRFQRVDQQLQRFSSGEGAKELSVDGWTTHEWLRFLRGLPQELTLEQLEDLDDAFEFTDSGNAEILCQWFLHTIRNGYEPADQALEDFLVEVGRRKFLQPLYDALSQTEEGKAWAKEIYSKARPNYHSVSVGTIDGILEWEE